MKTILKALCVLGALVCISTVHHAPSAQQAPERKTDPFPGWNERIDETNLDFRHYYDLAEVNETCEMFASRFPELVSMREIGRSYHDRPIYCVTMCARETGTHDTKPAMYIDSNIHGNETQGTEIILVTIWYLLRNYGHEPWVTDLVNTRTFYFVPVVNPDSRHMWFNEPNNPHSLRQNHRPFDNDRDGRYDEDPPNDLDGDGRITMMRKKDPNGRYVLGKDKRIMERRADDQPGEYKVWRSEGIDDDGDGQINEDDLGGVDLNRNFPSGWAPRYEQWGAGDFPCSEPEVKACVDFILDHPNIAGMQFYHNAARMILRPPGSSSDAGVVPREDVQTFDHLGERGERIIPGYRYLQTHDGLYKALGTQIDFGYLGLGRFCFTNELWGRTGHEVDGHPGTSSKDIRDWYDEFGMGRSYIEWKEFDHPTLGKIEIGGWDQFATRMPPAELFIEEGFRNALFTLKHAESFAELEFVSAEKKVVAPGAVRVRFAIKNRGDMPTDSALAAEIDEDTPVMVNLAGLKSGNIISAGLATNETYAEVRLQNRVRKNWLEIPRIRSQEVVYAEIVFNPSLGPTEATLRAYHPRAVAAVKDINWGD